MKRVFVFLVVYVWMFLFMIGNSINSSFVEVEYPDVDYEEFEVEVYHPSMEVSDSDDVWHTETVVDVFDVVYVNNERVVTVKSSNSQKLIAPGTSYSYVFKLKNDGDVAMDYVLEVDVDNHVGLPITWVLTRYDGKVMGSKEHLKDMDTLARDCYVYYVFDWCWLYDGDDDMDTEFGDRAVDEDLLFRVVFDVVSSVSDEVGSGIVDTGDTTSVSVWYVLGMVILVVLYKCCILGYNSGK